MVPLSAVVVGPYRATMAFDPGGPQLDAATLFGLAGAAEERADQLRADAEVLDALGGDIAGTVAGVAGGLGGDVWLGDAARTVGARFDEAGATELIAVAALAAAADLLRQRAVAQARLADDYRSRAQAAAA